MVKKRILLILVIIGLVAILGFNGGFAILTDKIDDLFKKDTPQINTEAVGTLVSQKEIVALADSDVDDSKYTFDTLYYPYYGMLNDEEQILYAQIYANAIELSSTFKPKINTNALNLDNAMKAVYNDHPELFWVDTNYSYKFSGSGNCVQVTLRFNELANNIESSKKKFDSVANSIIKVANNLSSDYEKEKYVHDAILNIALYQTNAPLSQSAYSALVNGRTVCAGYARAFQYIMMQLNIPTYYVVGYANEDHSWNIVKLSDGYYNVDLTWDDSNEYKYAYFNKTDADLTNRYRVGMSVSLPACYATSYRESTPLLEEVEPIIEYITISTDTFDNEIQQQDVAIDQEEETNEYYPEQRPIRKKAETIDEDLEQVEITTEINEES